MPPITGIGGSPLQARATPIAGLGAKAVKKNHGAAALQAALGIGRVITEQVIKEDVAEDSRQSKIRAEYARQAGLKAAQDFKHASIRQLNEDEQLRMLQDEKYQQGLDSSIEAEYERIAQELGMSVADEFRNQFGSRYRDGLLGTHRTQREDQIAAFNKDTVENAFAIEGQDLIDGDVDLQAFLTNSVRPKLDDKATRDFTHDQMKTLAKRLAEEGRMDLLQGMIDADTARRSEGTPGAFFRNADLPVIQGLIKETEDGITFAQELAQDDFTRAIEEQIAAGNVPSRQQLVDLEASGRIRKSQARKLDEQRVEFLETDSEALAVIGNRRDLSLLPASESKAITDRVVQRIAGTTDASQWTVEDVNDLLPTLPNLGKVEGLHSLVNSTNPTQDPQRYRTTIQIMDRLVQNPVTASQYLTEETLAQRAQFKFLTQDQLQSDQEALRLMSEVTEDVLDKSARKVRSVRVRDGYTGSKSPIDDHAKELVDKYGMDYLGASSLIEQYATNILAVGAASPINAIDKAFDLISKSRAKSKAGVVLTTSGVFSTAHPAMIDKTLIRLDQEVKAAYGDDARLVPAPDHKTSGVYLVVDEAGTVVGTPNVRAAVDEVTAEEQEKAMYADLVADIELGEKEAADAVRLEFRKSGRGVSFSSKTGLLSSTPEGLTSQEIAARRAEAPAEARDRMIQIRLALKQRLTFLVRTDMDRSRREALIGELKQLEEKYVY